MDPHIVFSFWAGEKARIKKLSVLAVNQQHPHWESEVSGRCQGESR